MTRYEGPERIATEWWRASVDRLPDPEPSHERPYPKRDDLVIPGDEIETPLRQPSGKPLLTRDYFRVEDVRGRRFWLFRHGLYDRETAAPVWYIHGLFA